MVKHETRNDKCGGGIYTKVNIFQVRSLIRFTSICLIDIITKPEQNGGQPVAVQYRRVLYRARSECVNQQTTEDDTDNQQMARNVQSKITE